MPHPERPSISLNYFPQQHHSSERPTLTRYPPHTASTSISSLFDLDPTPSAWRQQRPYFCHSHPPKHPPTPSAQPGAKDPQTTHSAREATIRRHRGTQRLDCAEDISIRISLENTPPHLSMETRMNRLPLVIMTHFDSNPEHGIHGPIPSSRRQHTTPFRHYRMLTA
jgi:hypothetical protein